MAANPKPDYLLAFPNAHGPVVDTDADRIDRIPWVNQFEAQSGMKRVLFEESVGASRLATYLFRQLSE